jgi:hypothetical protein
MQPRLKLDPLQLGAISSYIEFQCSGSENPAQSIREVARSMGIGSLDRFEPFLQ